MAARLHQDANGTLHWLDGDGEDHAGVSLVRAFPLTAPDEAICVVGVYGNELHEFASLAALDDEQRRVIESALSDREFMPVIERINSVSRRWIPTVWAIDTDHGATDLALDSEEAIRRIDERTLLVRDARGICFLIKNYPDMDRRSRRLLERFL